MTLVSRIAKFSRVDGEKIDFHLDCQACRQKNRVRLGPQYTEIERSTCSHFHNYSLTSLRSEGVVYFKFAC